MKNKYVYIIAAILTIEMVCFIELSQRDEATISTLTQQNATLQEENVELNQLVTVQDELIKAQCELIDELFWVDEPEQDKADRSGERPRYSLTDAERNLIERVVMAESGGECLEGQILVAQCILNACEIDGIRPAEVIKRYVYAKGRPEPSDSAKEAVLAVFDKGETVTDEPIVYFYAPGKVKSEFHEAQRFAVEVGAHRFFSERQAQNLEKYVK